MDRFDLKKQSAIDQAIVMFDRGRRSDALVYLELNDIPVDVAKRVLFRPDLRRQYINDYLTGF